MNSMVQAQQTTIQAAAPRIVSKCTPHLRGWNYHIHYADFEVINEDFAPDADALRGFETMTDRRIEELRLWQQLPADTLPDEEELWLEVSGHGLQEWTLNVYGHATYDYSIARLIDRGFLRRRFVARRGYSQDVPQIVVDDEDGHYMGVQGRRRNAIDEGYRVIRRQYLYEIDVVNAALAKLAGQSPPAPMRREKRVPGETTKSTPGTTNDHGSRRVAVPQGVEMRAAYGASDSFTTENNTDRDALSLEIAENPLKELADGDIRRAAWTAETLIALASQFLAVPAQIDEEKYDRDWTQPAQSLIERTADLDPRRAWEIIERHIAAMLEGPTWYAQKRTKKTAFALRHVESNWSVVEGEVSKVNWWPDRHIDYDGPPLFVEDAQTANSYAQGYTGTQSDFAVSCAEPSQAAHDTAQTIEVVAQAPLGVRTTKPLRAEDAQTAHDEPAQAVVIVEDVAHDLRDEGIQGIAQPPLEPLVVDARQGDGDVTQGIAQPPTHAVQGMDDRAARMVVDRIARKYPCAIIACDEVSPGLFIVGVEIALNVWYDFVSLREWLPLSEEAVQRLAQAECYGRSQRQAAQSNDAHGPPGGAQLGEGGGEGYGS